MGETQFWENPQEAQTIIESANQIRKKINPVIDFENKVEDMLVLFDLVKEEEDEELGGPYKKELEDTIKKLSSELDVLEIESFLSGKHDYCNAILTIHAGAGGTESCDWAEMLFRMYMRWAEHRGFGVEVQDIQAGEEAGISSASIRIIGEMAYGYAKAERGVHRLVRISPFDANKKRHTSFCSVDIIAEIEDDLDIEIKEEDIRIDTYRASGKGGQHVNKTESAIRITHLPTNIVVTCQNDRSQHKNKASALKTLKSRLYERQEDQKRAQMEKFYGEKGEIGWGNQIRSYVFQPYQMVKDLRTGAETSNVSQVMDGNIDLFINAWLRAGSPTKRNKEISLND